MEGGAAGAAAPSGAAPPVRPGPRRRRAAARDPRRLRRDHRPDRRLRHGHGRPRQPVRAGVDWEAEVAAYDAGLSGSRRLMTLEMSLVDADPAELFATAAAQPHDAGFVPFVRRAQAAGIPVEVVSDGFGFFIEPALVALGVPELPVITARTTFAGRRASIEYPNGNPRCHICGTCKRDRVLAHRAAGRAGGLHRRRRERPLRGGLQRHRVREALAGPDLPRGRLAVPSLDRVRRDRGLAGRDARGVAGGPVVAAPCRRARRRRTASSAARRSGARASWTRRRGTGRPGPRSDHRRRSSLVATCDATLRGVPTLLGGMTTLASTDDGGLTAMVRLAAAGDAVGVRPPGRRP